jgi:4-hydroxy-3-methylbut-2-enyl diphosphate reductase
MGDLAVVTASRFEALHPDAIGTLVPGTAVALTGVAQSLDPALRPGDLVVASELRATDGTPPRLLAGAALVADDLRRQGLSVHLGPVVSVPTAPAAAESAFLAAGGSLAWDTESAGLAGLLADHPLVIVYTIVETVPSGVETVPPSSGLSAAFRASLEHWAQATGPHDVLLASPRSFCAGVERAIEIVERALDRYGAPVYVRRQIVHNAHVVADLEAKGAIFVAELGDVPDGATVVLAAHGVSPAVRLAASARPDLAVIDATCPLVAKVHHEARRFVANDYQVVLIGHADHEEVAGTLGEAPDRIALVQQSDDVAQLAFDDDREVAYLTQTTLSTDETAQIVDALRARFPRLVGPTTDDICYATQNRQDAVRALAGRCDLILVVGSSNSSNTLRLVEVGRRAGCRTELVEDASALQLGWLADVATVGVTAGASAPESLVQGVVDALRMLGPLAVTEHRTVEESVQFSLPRQVR